MSECKKNDKYQVCHIYVDKLSSTNQKGDQGGGEADVIQEIHVPRFYFMRVISLLHHNSSSLLLLTQPSEREVLDINAGCIVRPNPIGVWVAPPEVRLPFHP